MKIWDPKEIVSLRTKDLAQMEIWDPEPKMDIFGITESQGIDIAFIWGAILVLVESLEP